MVGRMVLSVLDSVTLYDYVLGLFIPHTRFIAVLPDSLVVGKLLFPMEEGFSCWLPS